MAYFPFLMDIEGMKCLIVGGGRVAFRKTEMMLDFGAKVTIVAPNICSEILNLKENKVPLILHIREFCVKDLKDIQIVIAATNNERLNKKISKLCKEKNILVNVVDVKEECSFIFPAIIRQNNVLITVSSSGKSPAMSSYLKSRIEENIPEFYSSIVDTLGDFREEIQQRVKDDDQRKNLYYELIKLGERKEGKLSKEDVNRMIDLFIYKNSLAF